MLQYLRPSTLLPHLQHRHIQNHTESLHLGKKNIPSRCTFIHQPSQPHTNRAAGSQEPHCNSQKIGIKFNPKYHILLDYQARMMKKKEMKRILFLIGNKILATIERGAKFLSSQCPIFVLFIYLFIFPQHVNNTTTAVKSLSLVWLQKQLALHMEA